MLFRSRGFHAQHLESLRDALALCDAAEFTGWIPRQDLYDLYARASAFIYPSTFEGFGMPVLEAMAAGIPTGCSNIEPLAGIAGPAALRFPPDSIKAIVDALDLLTCDHELRQSLAAAGPLRAAQFTWDQTARDTLAAIRLAAGRSAAG